MLEKLAALILTFVLSFTPLIVEASPHEHAPTQQKTKQDEATQKKQVNWSEENLSLSKPQMKEGQIRDKKFYYFPYRQSMAPRMGYAMDLAAEDDSRTPYLLGLTYMFPKRRSPQWEIGFDLLSSSGGIFHVGSRKIYNERTYFRPFYKYGLAHYFVGREQLASFVNYENYLVQVSGGFEKVLLRPMSIRVEIEGMLGLKHQILSLILGYSWAW